MWVKKPKSVLPIALGVIGGGVALFILFATLMAFAIIGSSNQTTTARDSSVGPIPSSTPSYSTPPYVPPPVTTTVAPQPDDVYFDVLRRSGFTIKDRNAAITAGHLICYLYDQGTDTSVIMADLTQDGTFTNDQASMVIKAATTAYCPKYGGI